MSFDAEVTVDPRQGSEPAATPSSIDRATGRDARIACITHMDFPAEACLAAPRDSALAILTGTEGSAYRPAGATLVVRDGRVVTGSLSSGCVESDIARQAMACLETGEARRVRYGAGSPYFDVRLPCGGALDLVILPSPRRETLDRIVAARAARREIRVSIAIDGLRLDDEIGGAPLLRLRIIPDVAVHVFGKGPEAVHFTELAAAAGYETDLSSPDPETLAAVTNETVRKSALGQRANPAWSRFDRQSAVVLFFHDHEWEPQILAGAAASEAFYIGAQGGRRSRMNRDEALARLGVSAERIAAMKGPVGLIGGARDPRTLAISVLSEVAAEAERRRTGAEWA